MKESSFDFRSTTKDESAEIYGQEIVVEKNKKQKDQSITSKKLESHVSFAARSTARDESEKINNPKGKGKSRKWKVGGRKIEV